MKNEQILPLTSVRFIAALMVILYHAGPSMGGLATVPPFAAWIRYAGNAVTLFFVLSGFLITLRYYDNAASPSFDFAGYMVKRAARILPLYLVLLALTLLTSTQPAPVPVYATLTQNYFSDWNPSGLGVAWTLGIEELFYLLAPLLFRFIHRYGLVRSLTTAVIGLFVLGLLLVQMSKLTGLAQVGGFMANTSDMGHFTLFGRLFDFAAGIAAARLFMSGRVRWSSNWAVVGFALLLGYFSLRAAFDVYFLVENAVNVLICAPIVLSLAMPGGLTACALSWRPFVYGGKISYAMYLIHGTPLIFVLRTTSLPLFFLLIPALSIPAYQLIEKPAQQWIVRQWALHRPRTRIALAE